jgi:hypothetical protein
VVPVQTSGQYAAIRKRLPNLQGEASPSPVAIPSVPSFTYAPPSKLKKYFERSSFLKEASSVDDLRSAFSLILEDPEFWSTVEGVNSRDMQRAQHLRRTLARLGLDEMAQEHRDLIGFGLNAQAAVERVHAADDVEGFPAVPWEGPPALSFMSIRMHPRIQGALLDYMIGFASNLAMVACHEEWTPTRIRDVLTLSVECERGYLGFLLGLIATGGGLLPQGLAKPKGVEVLDLDNLTHEYARVHKLLSEESDLAAASGHSVFPPRATH